MTVARTLSLLDALEPWYAASFVALAIVAIVAAFALRASGGLFAAVAIVALGIARLPNIVTSEAVQADESGLVALAVRGWQAPIAWAGFDGSTSGPLDTYVLVPIAALPHGTWYVAARTIALLLHLLAVFATYGAVRALATPRLALLTAGGLAFFLAGSPDFELASFTTETLPMALTALAAFALARGWSVPAERGSAAALAGLFGGMLPFAKLQAAPLGAVAVAAAVLLAACDPRAVSRTRAAGSVLLAAAIVPAAVLLPALAARAGENALVSYVLQSRAYVVRPSFSPGLYFADRETAIYFGALGLLATAGIVFALARKGGRALDPRFAPIAVALLATVAAIVASYLPGKDFLHYTLLAAVPLAVLTGAAVRLGANSLDARGGRRAFALETLLALTMLALATSRLALGAPSEWRYADPRIRDAPALAANVAEYAPPGRSTAVWGFDPGLYVATGTVMATEDSNTEWQIRAGRYRTYFRARYLREFLAARPNVFVDDVAGTRFANKLARERFDGADGFPALGATIRADYRLTACVAGARVFVRSDLLATTARAGIDPRAAACAAGVPR